MAKARAARGKTKEKEQPAQPAPVEEVETKVEQVQYTKATRTYPQLQAKRQSLVSPRNFVLWKILAGIPLLIAGLGLGAAYLNAPQNIMAGMGGTVLLAAGGLLLFTSLKSQDTGFVYKGKRKFTGKENTILVLAKKDISTGKDVPVKITFTTLNNPPSGARLHYVRTLKKHYYILFNDTSKKRLRPFALPDKKPFPPELYVTAACMQRFKDYIDYSPPSMLQKFAPLILILAIFIVGLLMLMTAPPSQV